MKSYMDLYIHHLAAEDKSPETLAQYRGALNRLELWLMKDHDADLSTSRIQSVTGVMLTEYYQYLHERQLAISTRNNYIVIIKEYFEFLFSIGVLERDPSTALHCARVKSIPDNDKIRMYSCEDVETFLNSIVNAKPRRNCLRDTAVVALIFATGMRASEVCNLNCSQMEEIRHGSVYCKRKGGNWKHVAVGSFAISYLEKYLLSRKDTDPDSPLFTSQKGQRLTRTALWKSLASKQRRADLPTGVHILRHTVLSAIDHDGGSALARDVGGHTSVVITNRYIHTTPEERKQAVDSSVLAKLMS